MEKFLKFSLITCGTLVGAAVLLLVGCYANVQWKTWRDCWIPPGAPNIKVLVSACEKPDLISFSPGFRYMLYSRTVGDQRERRVYDLEMDTTQKDAGCGDIWLTWLNDHLRLEFVQDSKRWHYRTFQVCDIHTGVNTKLVWVPEIGNTLTYSGAVVFKPTGAMQPGPGGKWIYRSDIVRGFQNAGQVYYVQEMDLAIALDAKSENGSTQNFVLSIPDEITHTQDVLQFLQANHVGYVEPDISGVSSASHSGMYSFANTDNCPNSLGSVGDSCMAIYSGKEDPFIEGSKQVSIISLYKYTQEGGDLTRAWMPDDSGVVFQFSNKNCDFCLYSPATPILKLLTSTQSALPSSVPTP